MILGSHSQVIAGARLKAAIKKNSGDDLRPGSRTDLKPNTNSDVTPDADVIVKPPIHVDPRPDSEVSPEPSSQNNPPSQQVDPGWFFVLAEVPGEPRFGMDVTYAAPKDEKNTWDNLSLVNFTPGSLFVLGSKRPTFNGPWPNDPGNDSPDLETWGRCSADMAGILLQKPVMMAIHGSELLKEF